MVRPFPISVAFSGDDAAENNNQGSNYIERSALMRTLGVEATLMGIGVDRVDYTKGILERFLAIERFLEKYPSYQGKFTFVQIGAPSRTHIKRYHDLFAEVEAEADRINWRFQSGKWKPIVFLKRQHSHQEIEPYYRAADLCLVTSLRTRRSHPQPVHRSGPRTARRLAGESLRHRSDRRCHPRRFGDGTGRQTVAHAPHAQAH
jgi:trehalose 6-phosphate synthase